MSDYKVFDTLQDAVLVLDEQCQLVYGNQAASALFEVSARRLASGKPMAQFVSFEPNAIGGSEDLALVTESTQVKEVAFECSSGKSGWAQVSVQPQPEFFAQARDEQRRWIVFLRDVSLEKTLHDKYRGELDKKEAVIRDLEVAREKLEDYSRNLEQMVEARTSELRAANQLLKTILDSLSQAILVFDRDGVCLPVFSQICLKLFETDPSGRKIEEVLKLGPDDAKAFSSWQEAVHQQMLDFEDLVPLAPDKFSHSKALEIALGYNLMKSGAGETQGIVVVGTDQTREVQALKEAQAEKELVKQVVQVARNKEAFRMFVADATSLLDQLISQAEFDSVELARNLHTLKGGAATFSLSHMVSSCHRFEEKLKTAEKDDRALKEFRIALAEEASRISELLKESVEKLAELLGLAQSNGQVVIEVPLSKLKSWSECLLEADENSSRHVMRQIGLEIRSECTEKPLGEMIKHFEDSLMELASQLGKQIQPIEIVGGDVRAPIEQLRPLLSSLVHAFRNSIDHGIESLEQREAAGKTPQGQIKVQFARIDKGEFEELHIEISDDGKGVNPDKVRNKLISQGVPEAQDMSDQQVIQAILRDDFSTTESITEISGRGVGLAAIANEAHHLGGQTEVISQVGHGMALQIRVPLRSNEDTAHSGQLRAA